MSMHSRFIILVLCLVVVAVASASITPLALAADPCPPNSLCLPNPLESDNVIDLINAALRFITAIAIPIAVIMIIWAGIKYLTAGSNPKAVGEANNIIWSVVIGLAIIFIGRGFVDLVESVLNIGGSSTSSPTPIPSCPSACPSGQACLNGVCTVITGPSE
ncbi:MAG: pilin [Patescibacteria group bacterium]